MQTTFSDGRKVSAIFIRRIHTIEGELTTIDGNDRLDIIASDKYNDPTRFWYIADANTQLDSIKLVKSSPREVIKILVPPP